MKPNFLFDLVSQPRQMEFNIRLEFAQVLQVKAITQRLLNRSRTRSFFISDIIINPIWFKEVIYSLRSSIVDPHGHRFDLANWIMLQYQNGDRYSKEDNCDEDRRVASIIFMCGTNSVSEENKIDRMEMWVL